MAKRTREDFDQPSTAQSSPETSTPNTLLSAGSNQGEMIQETAKVIHLDNQSSESSSIVEVMTCSLPPHRQPLSFSSYEDYETHYSKEHVNRCIECRKNFPTPHFLDLHQEENHNPLIVILKERGERIYSCFVEDCERKCSTPQKRRMHLVDKHMFPKDYNFDVVNDGIDHRSSMLKLRTRRRRSSVNQQTGIPAAQSRRSSRAVDMAAGEAGVQDGDSESMERVSEEASVKNNAMDENSRSDDDVDSITGAMAALKFVPPSVRFGRGRGRARGGFSRS